VSRAFVNYHLINCLEGFDGQSKPLDAFLRDYFYAHRAVGAHDRREICHRAYRLIRWRDLLDHLSGTPHDWRHRDATLHALSPEEHNDPHLPPHLRWSMPKWLYLKLEAFWGREMAEQLCRICNTQAPTTVRVNGLKATREQLIALLTERYGVTPCTFAPMGVHFPKREALMGTPEFRQGLFEIQDEGSQLVAQAMGVRPGQLVLDYCAGAGGKSLAIGVDLQGRGQLYLHDVRPYALLEARRRLRRAGIQNCQVVTEERQLNPLKGKMDCILVDAPCTGTGTLRRNPDAKWRLEPEAIERLVQQQREIVKEAMAYLRKGGRLVYATCSLLPEENQQQVAYFTREYGLKPVGLPLQTVPEEGGMDGFFVATLIWPGHA
jgi:16S rRNA (cytosine967-C5)-methyltransferase